MMTMCLNGKNTILISVILLLLCSCIKEYGQLDNDAQGKRSVCLNVSYPGVGTKTYLDGLSILWSEGDSVSVVAACTRYGGVRLDYDYSVKAQNIQGRTAMFVASLMGDHDPVCMIYPACEELKYDVAAGMLTTLTKNEFRAVAGTFPQESNLAMGVQTDGRFIMYNLMSVLKFEITASDIVEVVVETLGDESMSGNVTIDLESRSISSIDGWNHVKLLPEDGKEVFSPGIYYIPIPAIQYADGFVVDLKDNAGFHARKGKREAILIPANKLIDLGSQDDWNIEIHIGACISGELSFLEDNRFALVGNVVKGKDFELEDTSYGVELSTDGGMTWESICFGPLTSEEFDIFFEKPSPGKLLVRPWARYKDDDKTYGDVIVYRPEGNFLFTMNFRSYADIKTKFIYDGDNTAMKSQWEGTGDIDVSRNTNKLSDYGGPGYVDPYKFLLMRDLWAETQIGFPTDGNSTTWYTLETESLLGLYIGNKTTTIMIPAVPGCKLDRVLLAFTQSKRVASISEDKDALVYVGNYTSSKSSAAGSGNLSDLYVSEWQDLSTKAAASNKTTKENTPYFIYMNGGGRIAYMEFEYVPID